MSAPAVLGIVIGALVLIVLLAGAVSYNRFVTQRNLVEQSWQGVDVELQRRHDLIPNLVETVRGYAAHEKAVFDAVTAARAQAVTAAGQQAKASAENTLNNALGSLVAVAEGYPQLKASANFLQLQGELVDTEDRIAAGRRFYNGNVRALNTRCEAFPSVVIARMFGVKPAAYFPLDDPKIRSAIDVGFDR